MPNTPEKSEKLAEVVSNSSRLMKRFGPEARRYLFDKEEIIVVVAEGAAVIFGHGSGSMIGQISPEMLAQLLQAKQCLVGVEVVFLAACWTGVTSVGKRLYELLGIQVWAPIGPACVTNDGILTVLFQGKPLTSAKEVPLYWHSCGNPDATD